MTRRLEPLGAAHAGLIAGMHHVCFKEPWNEEAMRSLLAMPGAFGFLAVDRTPQGFVLARSAADEAEILTLLVLPPYRRRGLARALLEAAVEKARAEGAKTMFLEVAANNRAGRALYIAAGFVQQGIRPRYYEDGVDALLLSRSL
jgi:ribosomal-protein-alanine N-acetyltransferase